MPEDDPRRAGFHARVLLALLLMPGIGASAAQDRPPRPSMVPPAPAGELTKLAEGVYVHIVSPDGDAVSNSGAVVLDDGVLVFDTHFTPEAGANLLEQLRKVTPLPVRYLVDSHFHPDHTHGNQSFPQVRQIIGSTQTRKDMLQRDVPEMSRMQAIAQAQVDQLGKQIAAEQDARRLEALRTQMAARQTFVRRMSALKILPPLMTFDDRLTIVDGARELQLLAPGPGHTHGDVVLYLKQERVAFLGDLFFNAALPNVEDASLLEWTATLREVLALDAATFVPGHGQVGTRRDVQDFLGYLTDLKALVEPVVARGDTLEQVVAELHVPSRYASWSFQNFFPANVQKMYEELKAIPPPAPEKGTVKKKEGRMR